MSFDILSFAFIHLQNRPRNSCGMEHPRTKSWTAPGREKITVQTTNSAKSLLFPGILTFLLSWRLRLPLSWSHCRLLHPSQPSGMQGLSVCCSEQSRTCYTSPALFILATYKLIFIYLKFPSVGSGSLSKSPPFHHVLMDICSLNIGPLGSC